MKKLIFALLLIPSLVFAGEPIDLARMNVTTVAGAGVAAATCGQTISQETNTSFQNVASASTIVYIAGSFTADGNVIKTIYLYLKDGGSPHDLNVKICPDNSGTPDDTGCVATDTPVCPTTTCTSSTANWYHVNIAAGTTPTASARYWIVVNAAEDASNYFIISFNNGVTGQSTQKSADGTDGSWTAIDGSSQLNFKFSSCAD